MARIRVKKGLSEITSNDTHKAFTIGSMSGYNESWDEAGLRKHAKMALEVADYLKELTAKGYKEDNTKAYLNDSLTKYKGYSIEQNFYGKGEYTVQYQGDDVVFKSVEEAKEFINGISDSFNDEKYPKGVHNRSTLYGQYHNGTIWYDGDGFYAINGSADGKWFSTIEEAYKFVGYVKDSNNYIGNARIVKELPKVGEQISHLTDTFVTKVEKIGSKDGYSLYTVKARGTDYAKDGSEDAKFTYAVKDVKDSTMFKVTDKKTGRVRLVRATDSLEAIDKVSNISNLGGKK